MTFIIKQFDTRNALKATLKNAWGKPVDLTGSTVRFVMSDYNRKTVLIDRDITVQDFENGIVWMVFEDGDTEKAGIFKVEFQVQFPDGRRETFPNSGYITVQIEPSLGGM